MTNSERWRPLDWKDFTYKGIPEFEAHHPFGSYNVRFEAGAEWPWVLRPFISGPSNYLTREDAQAAAEADYFAKLSRASLPLPPEPTP